MLMLFQRGSSAAQKAKVSVISRMDGAGVDVRTRATYSFRMSFWIVP